MEELRINGFAEMSQDDMMAVNGGVVGWIILGGVACLGGGFAIGYGLARWLG